MKSILSQDPTDFGLAVDIAPGTSSIASTKPLTTPARPPSRWRSFLPSLLLGLICGTLALGSSPKLQAQEKQLEEEIPTPAFPRNIVVFGKDVVLKTNEVSEQLVVIGGNAKVDGAVKGDLVVVFGSVELTGTVDGSLVAALGSANLRDRATVAGDATVVGGKLNLDSAVRIGGDQHEIVLGTLLPDLHWMGEWFRQGFLRARPLSPWLGWMWVLIGFYALICFLVGTLFSRPVQACVSAIETQPTGSFFVGVMGLVLFGPIVLLLVISVAGILAVPILFLALAAAVFFGNLAVYRSTGQQLGRQFNLSSLQQPAISLLLGLVVFMFLYMVPVLGFAVFGIATVWGLGAVLMAVFASFRREDASAPSIATPTAPLPNPLPVATPSAPPDFAHSAESVTLARVGFWRRLWATLLDLVLLAILLPITGPVFILIWTAYHVAMWTWKGTTIGGIVAGIKIVRTDGQPPNFAVALVRSLSSFFSLVVLGFGFFWAGWDREKQAWHDKIAGTAVVKVPKGMALI